MFSAHVCFSLAGACALACTVLNSCQQQQSFEPYSGYKMSPYTIKGMRFVPMNVDQALHYKAEGIASHYEADGDHGALSNPLYKGQFYAAHRTLPLPCEARITNLSNGKSCVVRIADRGPFIPGRLIDVSSAVAHKLDFHTKGLDRVRIEVLSVGDGKWKRTR